MSCCSAFLLFNALTDFGSFGLIRYLLRKGVIYAPKRRAVLDTGLGALIFAWLRDHHIAARADWQC